MSLPAQICQKILKPRPGALLCIFLLVATSSFSSTHAPTASYSKEKVICIPVDTIGATYVQLSKGRVSYLSQYGNSVTDRKIALLDGDVIYTGTDGFVSIVLPNGHYKNVQPESQVRIKQTDQCQEESINTHRFDFMLTQPSVSNTGINSTWIFRKGLVAVNK